MEAHAHSFKAKLHKAATLYYDSLPLNEKDTLMELFRKLDKDGNGSISQEELASELDGVVASLRNQFSLLDEDGNGSLDLQECKALLFLCSAFAYCDRCHDIIIDNLSFMCQDCLKLEKPCEFNLCLKCFPSMASFHPPHHVFAPPAIILHRTLQQQQAQCAICGDFHIKDATGILIGSTTTHMVQRPDGEYVCEWCCTWSCNNCAKFHVDIASASPSQWVIGTFHCSSCGKAGYKTNMDPVIKAIKESKVLEECKTCKIKANNDMLWATYTTSITTTRSPSVLKKVCSAALEGVLESTISNVVQIGISSCSIM